MELPLFIFPLIYLVVFAIYLFFAGIHIYHVARFGFFDFRARLMTFAFIGSILLILGATAMLLAPVDWAGTLSLSSPSIYGDLPTFP